MMMGCSLSLCTGWMWIHKHTATMVVYIIRPIEQIKIIIKMYQQEKRWKKYNRNFKNKKRRNSELGFIGSNPIFLWLPVEVLPPLKRLKMYCSLPLASVYAYPCRIAWLVLSHRVVRTSLSMSTFPQDNWAIHQNVRRNIRLRSQKKNSPFPFNKPDYLLRVRIDSSSNKFLNNVEIF